MKLPNETKKGDRPFDLDIFSDCSFAPQKRIGVAAYLIIAPPYPSDLPPFQYQVFTDTTNSKLELQAICLALEEVEKGWLGQAKDQPLNIRIFTDSKTAVDLPHRRQKLEANNFCSKKTGRPLTQASEYQSILAYLDRFTIEFCWLKGHRPLATQRSVQERIFASLDRFARKKLRQ